MLICYFIYQILCIIILFYCTKPTFSYNVIITNIASMFNDNLFSIERPIICMSCELTLRGCMKEYDIYRVWRWQVSPE